MATTTVIMSVLMAAVVSAGYSSSNDKFQNPSKMFQFISPLPLPQLPGFPALTAPPLLWPINFPNFAPMAPIRPMPSFPPLTVQEIANQGPSKDSNYNGAAIISQSSSVRGPDGKIKREGGSTVLLNDNGRVTMQQIGKAPPVVVTHYTNQPFPDFPDLEDFMSSKFKMPSFKPLSFDMPKIEPLKLDFPKIDSDTIKNHVPGKNENYHASYHSSSSSFSDDNGVKKSSGRASSIVNNNGKVNEENLAFEKGPK